MQPATVSFSLVVYVLSCNSREAFFKGHWIADCLLFTWFYYIFLQDAAALMHAALYMQHLPGGCGGGAAALIMCAQLQRNIEHIIIPENPETVQRIKCFANSLYCTRPDHVWGCLSYRLYCHVHGTSLWRWVALTKASQQITLSRAPLHTHRDTVPICVQNW